MEMVAIYKITNPNGLVYIGQTNNVSKRKSAYKRGRAERQPLIDASIKKYGWAQHRFEIVHELPEDVRKEVVDVYEVLYISQYRSNRNRYKEFKGLNLTDGGGGCAGKVYTDEQKRAISIRLTGKKRAAFTDEHRQNISEAHKNVKQSDETIAKRIAKTIGLKRSDDFCLRMSQLNIGKTKTDEAKARMSAGQMGKKYGERSEEYRKKLSDNAKRQWQERRIKTKTNADGSTTDTGAADQNSGQN